MISLIGIGRSLYVHQYQRLSTIYRFFTSDNLIGGKIIELSVKMP